MEPGFAERFAQYSMVTTILESYAGKAMVDGLTDHFERIRSHPLRLVSFEQRSEWAYWATLTENREVDISLCNPIVRRYGSNFST